MKTFKVLMVSHLFPPKFGGAAVQSIYLSHELQRQGVSVDYFTDAGSAKSHWTKHEGLKVYKARTFTEKSGGVKVIFYVFQLLLFVLKNPRYDILHFHAVHGAECVLFPIFRGLGKKVVCKMTLVGSDDPIALRKRKLGIFFIWGLSFVNALVSITPALTKLARQAGIKEKKIFEIPNGVDVKKFKIVSDTEKEILKKKLRLDQYKNIFLSIGKIEKRKGYDFLLKSWKKISADLSASVLLIIGPANENTNDYYRELLGLIQAEKLTGIIFLGERNNVEEYMGIADCFLFCSLQEGFGNVLVEAMSSGLPVVSRYIEGATDSVVLNPDIGTVVVSESIDVFSRAVLAMIGKKDAEKIRQASHNIQDSYNMERIGSKYREVYGQLLLT